MLGLIDSEVLTNIANSIREKTGKTEQMTPTDMPTEISQIQAGGGGGGMQSGTVYSNTGVNNGGAFVYDDGSIDFVTLSVGQTYSNVSFIVLVCYYSEPPVIDGSVEMQNSNYIAGSYVVIAKVVGDCVINTQTTGGGGGP